MSPTSAPPAPPARDLPAVLGLRPHHRVFRLGPGERFIGLDPATALVAEDLTEPLAAMLDDLADPVHRDDLVARAVDRGAEPAAALALLTDLHRAGAVVDAAPRRLRQRQRADATVLVHGDGPLAVGIATGLGLAGIGTVHVRSGGAVMAADLGTGLVDDDRGRPRQEAAAAAVAALAPGALTGPPPARLAADLVVLTDALVPEPDQVAALHAARTAHLVVRLRDGTGVVGPLVLPRRTTCLRCLDLHRIDRDPVWPRVAAQLTGRPGRADPACVTATAALATAQALIALDGISGGAQPPAVLDATLELDAAAGTLLRRDWTPHPDCGCGATAPPETRRGMGHG